MFRYEDDMVEVLEASVPRLWGVDARYKAKVRCHDQATMDLFVATPALHVAIEAKLASWQRVLYQAYLHRYCVDQTFIAMPAPKLRPHIIEEAQYFDIGVISVDRESAVILAPSGPCRPVQRIRDRLLRHLNAEEG